MRVTQRMILDNSVKDMTNTRSAYYDSMQKASLGKQFRWASDNPAHAAAALSIRSTLDKSEAYIDTGRSLDLWMNDTSAALSSMENLATRAINLVLEGKSDTMGIEQRKVAAKEIDMILQQAITVGNTRHQGQHYIFSGFQTNTKPFEIVTNPSPPPDTIIQYSGDSGEIKRNIAPEQPITANIPGTVFIDPNHGLFNALIRARDALNNNDMSEMDASVTDLRNSISYISGLHTEYGARQRELQRSLDRMETSKIDLKSLLSQKEDVDMAEAISTLKQQEIIYQSVLQVSNRALALTNLFDLM